MKKKRLILLLIITGLCSMVTYLSYRYYAPPSLRQPYPMNNQEEDTLQIAYIGDSWAFMHIDHNCHITKLLEDTLHQPVSVHSYGICGLTSKEVYENMFSNSDFKHFLQKRGYAYCFVSAGINDTYKKMSTIYYQHSIDGIIQFLLANNVHPIILEIPDYNIQKSFERQKFDRKMLRQISMFVNNTPINCKQLFRDALNELIREKRYQKKVSIIRYKSWNNDFLNDLALLYLDDGLHLNEKGYSKLDNVIAQELISLTTVKQ